MHSIRIFTTALCLTAFALMGCKKKPITPTAANAAPQGKAATGEAALVHSNDDPLQWPITLLLDKNGRAVPPITSQWRKNDPRMMADADEDINQLMLIANPSGVVRQPFKTIVRPAPKTVNKGGRRTHEVKGDGTRTDFDADTGQSWTYPPEGGAIGWDAKGGKYTYIDPEGGVKQVDPGNKGGEGSTISQNPNGSFDSVNDDGSGAHLYPVGEPGPGGSLGYTYGPGGPESGRTEFFDGGETTEIPAPTGPDFGSDRIANSDDPKDGSSEPFTDGSGPGGDRMASGVGEPHYTTTDGTGYTTQTVGEFVLVSGKKGREVQARHEPWKNSNSISAITAMAFLVGTTKVEFRIDGTVLMDGLPAPEGNAVQGDIPGGGAIGVWRSNGKIAAGVVVWPDLSAAWVIPHDSWMDFHLRWKDLSDDHRGLLGCDDGDPENDLIARDGVIAQTNDEKAMATFVNSWRVSDSESLFTYKPGQSTKTFTMLDFPKQEAQPQFVDLAEKLCKDMPEGWIKQQCFYDISMTGDASFLVTYKELFRRNNAKLVREAAKIAKKKTVAGDVLKLEPADKDAATLIESNATIEETLAAGISKVYRFTVENDNSAPVGILSENLKPGEKYAADRAGYALFDEQGKSLAGTLAATSDMNFGKLKLGTYYLKITGPGLIHIKIN